MTASYSGRKVFLNLVASLAGSAAGLVSLSITMHLLGRDGLAIRGVITFAATIVGMVTLFGDMGFTNAHIKRVSEGRDLARCVGTFLAIRLAQCVLVVAVCLPMVLSGGFFSFVSHLAQRSDLTGKPTVDFAGVERIVLAITILSVVLNQLSDVWRQTYAARREVVHQRLPIVLGNWLQVPAAVSVCVLIPASPRTAVWLALSNLVTPVTALIYYLVRIRQVPVDWPTRATLSDYGRFAMPMSVASALLPIQLYLDKWLLRIWVGYEAVGLYELCQKVVSTLDRQILAQIGNLVLSKVSELHSRSRLDDIRTLVHTAERYLAAIAVPSAAVLIAGSGALLSLLYGRSAAAGAAAFSFLALVGLSSAINRPYAQAVSGMDRPGCMLWLGLTIAALDLVLNVIFIPSSVFGIPMLGMGIEGAALSTLLAGLAGTVLNRFFAWRVGRIGVQPALFRHLAAGAVALILGSAAAGWAGPEAWRLAAAAPVCVGAYLAAALVLGAITREDLRFFKEAADLGRARDHILSEFKSNDP